ncbi:hypothetical protein IQ230_14035 [Gloeocapsopsis crepidinum LEGE 06123]|uniref:Uncharacterized protein n=1 Tax=Gloeocapsopsis crepidinum LEGE 06123 TaxID=588587 RepID=A0ABR9UT17_9CHRO|nr:hypothetical protein [Gloeocapsopsis crepidinum]MBE9191446.1 hypothetical protein [Gloeocapsopsis crepidinum LEGE 06123]
MFTRVAIARFWESIFYFLGDRNYSYDKMTANFDVLVEKSLISSPSYT